MIPVLMALASGAALALALPPFDMAWLGWVALAPLLATARERRTLEAAGLGLLAGGACGLVQLGHLPGSYGPGYADLPFFCLAILLGILSAAAGAAARRWQGGTWVLFVACAGIGVEWLTTFCPLPLHLALSQHRNWPVLQLASLTGVWGISFLLWWSCAAGAELLARRRLDLATLLATVGLAGSLPSACLLAAPGPPGGPPLRVAAIQDYQPGEAGKAAPEEGEGAAPDRETLTRRAAADGARLTVWAELALGNSFAPDEPEDPTRALARELGTYLVAGYSESGTPRGHNCAALIGPDGTVLGVHRKVHLFLGERRDTAPGSEARAFDSPMGRIGVEICFDTCYTGLTRRIAADGAQLIAMPNYDPPTPGGVLHRLHAAMLPFRAAENRVPFVRADPTGISQIIDRTGRLVGESGLWRSDVLVGEVAPGDGKGTLFTRLGDWLAYLCVAGVAAFGAAALAGRSGRASGCGIVETEREEEPRCPQRSTH